MLDRIGFVNILIILAKRKVTMHYYIYGHITTSL